MARELNVIGLMNVQYAIKEGDLFVLEVNPRASRTIPFVSKATGVPLAKIATRVMTGSSLSDLGFTREIVPAHVSVKEAVLPFDRFPDVDTLLGPEMKSTGEVMGIDTDFGRAYAKSQIAAGQHLPVEGVVFISVQDSDKEAVLPVARTFREIGFRILATRGTSRFFTEKGVDNRMVNKVSAGRPHVVDAILNHEIHLVINTGTGDETRRDGYMIRRAALKLDIPYATTVAGAKAMSRGIAALKEKALGVKPIQGYHE
jgi:carbamoyl-phosphate synthase large subunit